MNIPLITRSKDILGGTPVFYGTRVPVRTLIDYLAGGETLDEFLDNFPAVTREQAVNFLRHAEELLVAQIHETIDGDTNLPLPFESYPERGLKLLGRVPPGSCRDGYCRKFMQLTGQTRCAYCSINLVDRYENWLIMALDHVVPNNALIKWELPQEWGQDYSNRVLCCATCNTFDNRYQPPDTLPRPSTLEDFYTVRDTIFIERRNRILNRHKAQRAFFDAKPWMPMP